MGDTASEQCGDVAPVPCSALPVRVEAPLAFVEIDAGAGHVCARTARAEVFCWGSNAQGQIGSPGREERGRVYPPRHVSVPGETTVIAIAVGASHSCALTRNGALFCWGSDAGGQLGSGRNVDVEESPLRSQWRLVFHAISAGGYHTCGLTPDGEVYCWGDNQFGALGGS
jgi:alpha-tubulin suppressor-like RCC1 family protein